MELRSKKLSKELKDLDRINDADLDTSDMAEISHPAGDRAGEFNPQAGYRRETDNN